jgi:hypothetical protein
MVWLDRNYAEAEFELFAYASEASPLAPPTACRGRESRVDADRWSGQRFAGRLGEWPFDNPHRRRKKKACSIATAKDGGERPPHFAYATTKHLRLLDCYYIAAIVPLSGHAARSNMGGQ